MAQSQKGVNMDPTGHKQATDGARTTLVFDKAINYAFQQNAIPVVKELRFHNDTSVRKDLRIRLTTEPAFAEPMEHRLQSIEAGAEFRIAPLDLKLSPDYLASLNERIAGWLSRNHAIGIVPPLVY